MLSFEGTDEQMQQRCEEDEEEYTDPGRLYYLLDTILQVAQVAMGLSGWVGCIRNRELGWRFLLPFELIRRHSLN